MLNSGSAACYSSGTGPTKFECTNSPGTCLDVAGATPEVCDGDNDCGGSAYLDELGCWLHNNYAIFHVMHDIQLDWQVTAPHLMSSNVTTPEPTAWPTPNCATTKTIAETTLMKTTVSLRFRATDLLFEPQG